MIESPEAVVIDQYSAGHRVILSFLERLTDAELAWRVPGGNQPIAWHAWHLARWADHLQACVPGMSPERGRRLGLCPQLWDVEGLAGKWGFDSAQLGYGETVMYMADDLAVSMGCPPKAVLFDYVGRAFAQADRITGAIDAEQFVAPEQLQLLTNGSGAKAS